MLSLALQKLDLSQLLHMLSHPAAQRRDAVRVILCNSSRVLRLHCSTTGYRGPGIGLSILRRLRPYLKTWLAILFLTPSSETCACNCAVVDGWDILYVHKFDAHPSAFQL